MNIHIFFHPGGKVWAINQTGDCVVHGGFSGGLNKRDTTKKELWKIIKEKEAGGYREFGILRNCVTADNFLETVRLVRDLYHRGAEEVGRKFDKPFIAPIMREIAGWRGNDINPRSIRHAQSWVAVSDDFVEPIRMETPKIETRIQLAGRSCFF